MLPLEGIRVLEIAGMPGTWTTGFLGDFGAEVIKIERVPAPEREYSVMGLRPVRSPEDQRRRLAYDSINRNKKSIALNLKVPEAVDIFLGLAKISDVIVEGYRPGVAARLGIGYEDVKKVNPRLVYCAISGYGQTGPYRNMPGHDINYIGLGGVLGLTGEAGRPPSLPGTQVADLAGGGSMAVIAVLLGLMARDRTGNGQYIDLSITDGVIALLVNFADTYFAEGVVPRRGETVATGGYACNSVYETKDNKYVSIGCWEPRLYENLCRAVGKEELIPFQYSAGEKQGQLKDAFQSVFKTRTGREWFELLKDKDVCISPVYDFTEVLEDPQVKTRGMFTEMTHPDFGKVCQMGRPFKLDQTPAEIKTFAPQQGQHTVEILTKYLGLSEADISQLRTKKAI